MDALNYSEAAATIFCYPPTLGAALYNFIFLIFKRHPSKDTSLVDYSIVSIIIPNVLYGSMVGASITRLIPPIVADTLITALLVFFCFKFVNKIKKLRSDEKEQKATL